MAARVAIMGLTIGCGLCRRKVELADCQTIIENRPNDFL